MAASFSTKFLPTEIFPASVATDTVYLNLTCNNLTEPSDQATSDCYPEQVINLICRIPASDLVRFFKGLQCAEWTPSVCYVRRRVLNYAGMTTKFAREMTDSAIMVLTQIATPNTKNQAVCPKFEILGS